MKSKIFAMTLMAFAMLSFSACAQNNKKAAPAKGQNKILVAYFSATGTTKAAAVKIAKATGGKLFEITPKQKYTDDDLDWTNKQSRTTLEHNDPKIKPEIVGKIGNFKNYSVVFVGYPIWWGVAPNIINTFLTSENFEGKTIIPFCTSGGSKIEPSEPSLKKLAPKAKWLPGKLLNGAEQKDVDAWVSSLKLK